MGELEVAPSGALVQIFRIDRGRGRGRGWVLPYMPQLAISACHSQAQEIADLNTHTVYFNTRRPSNEASETGFA